MSVSPVRFVYLLPCHFRPIESCHPWGFVWFYP